MSLNKRQKTKDNMTLSWNELACYGLRNKLDDPFLIQDILRLIKKARRDYLEDEARDFHSENMKQDDMFSWRRLVIEHSRVTDELVSSWEERRPYNRRGAIWSAFLSDGWRQMGEEDGEDFEVDLEVRVKCEWYEGIHEGRYYLFWHDSFRSADRLFIPKDITTSIDINIIEGRTEENPWTNQDEGVLWDPSYLRDGNKAKKHIDDMFLKE
jgi:hypothetical protein